jgi:hypothetical protein
MTKGRNVFVFCRAWHPRRIVYSNDVIAFAHTGTDNRIDAIPLFEVVEVVSMKDGGAGNDDHSSSGKIQRDASKTIDDDPLKKASGEKKSGDSNKVMFRNALQIHTKPDGYNSGRQYVIQARSEEERQTMVEELSRLSKIATDKFLAKSQFTKAQASPAPTILRSWEPQ